MLRSGRRAGCTPSVWTAAPTSVRQAPAAAVLRWAAPWAASWLPGRLVACLPECSPAFPSLPSNAGAWDLKAKYGLPYALTLGPYGAVLALTWQRDVAEPKTWLVALSPDPEVTHRQAFGCCCCSCCAFGRGAACLLAAAAGLPAALCMLLGMWHAL